MFSLREFILKGLKNAVGRMADYQVILNAAGWLEKGVLTEEDLSELGGLIDMQYVQAEAAPEEDLPDGEDEENV